MRSEDWRDGETSVELPPQSLEAERALLGAVLLDGEAFRKVAGTLTGDDFYKRSHGLIFGAMSALHASGDPLDVATISEQLKRTGDLETVGGISCLASLGNSVTTAANIRKHAEIVKEAARKRELRKALMAAQERLQTDGIDEILSFLRGSTSGIAQGVGAEIVTMHEVAARVSETVERRHRNRGEFSGIPSGFRDLDKMTDGWQPGDLIIIGARPGRGKSALGMACAQHAAGNGYPAGILSLEMSDQQIGMRTLANFSGIDMTRLQRGFIAREQWADVTGSVGRMAELPIYFSFKARTTQQIERAFTSFIEGKSVKLAVVDYLQLVRSTGQKNREQEVAEVSRLLKTMAQVHAIPVIALAQLNRAVESRDNKRPTLADLRDSGQIEQDADVIIFIHQDDQAAANDAVELIIAKGRNIQTGSIFLKWEPSTMRFRDSQAHGN